MDGLEHCSCRKPDITYFEMCSGCGNSIDYEYFRRRAITIYDDRYGNPIEDDNLPSRQPRMIDPSSSLRLLHMNSESSSHILSGTFECVDITHHRPYEAVSYTWGGQEANYTKSQFVIISGNIFPITENCAAALRKVRKERRSKPIWIDALCINQNDRSEKESQISQMGKIFRGADKIHIFLGEQCDDITASRALSAVDHTTSLNDLEHRLSADERVVAAVKSLFDQVYFTRMWIVQEVVLAKTATLHWGGHSVLWRKPSKQKLLTLKSHGIKDAIPAWLEVWVTQDGPLTSKNLSNLVFSTMGSRAKNDRDKVFGLYGLLLDAEEQGLTIDYKLSVWEVFTNMASYLIERQDDFEAVISHIHYGARWPDLPSWVPDFRRYFKSQDITMQHDGFKELLIHSTFSLSEGVSTCPQKGELYLPAVLLLPRRHQIVDLSRPDPTYFQSVVILERDSGLKTQWDIFGILAMELKAGDCFCWLANGLTFHLARHPTIAHAYSLKGRCVFRISSHAPDMWIQEKKVSIAEAMFPLQEPQFQALWRVYTSFHALLGRTTLKFGYAAMGPLYSMEEWADSHSAYRYFCSGTPVDFVVHNDGFYGQWKGLAWPVDISGGGEKMAAFRSFWEVKRTWKSLRLLRDALQFPSTYNRDKIVGLSVSWLRHYNRAKERSRELWGKNADTDGLTRQELLTILVNWEKVTQHLAKELQWTKGFFWPFSSPPQVIERHDNEDEDKAQRSWGEPREPEALLQGTFAKIRHRLEEAIAASLGETGCFMNALHILGPWDPYWTETIKAIPDLFRISDVSKHLNLEELFAMEEDCLKRGVWRDTTMEIHPPQIITIV